VLKDRRFLFHSGVEVPLICGAMYPCSNPELVAAVSEAGGLGVVQPLSLSYVHGRDFRAGLAKIRELTKKPVGLNVLTEKSLSKVYRERMERWIDAALEEDVRFFVTSLGNPRWVVERARHAGGVVYRLRRPAVGREGARGASTASSPSTPGPGDTRGAARSRR
jgi:nitronate monooxygenase